MAPLDPGIYPFIDGCLFLQAVFLNILWVTLVLAWHRAKGKLPGPVHLGAALLTWATVMAACLVGFPPLHWVLGLAIATGAAISVLDPALAICFTLSMLMMRPWEIMEPNAVILLVPKASTMFSFAWAAYYFVKVDKFGIRVNRVIVLLLAYMFWLFLSTFITPDPASSRETLNATMGPFLTLVYLIYHLARDRFAVWALKRSVMLVFTGMGFISLYFFAGGYRVTSRILSFGAFANSNDIAALMCILLPLSFFAFKQSKVTADKLLNFFSVVVGCLVVALAQSRGAIIAVMAGFAAHAFRKSKNKAAALGMVVVILAGGQLATMLFSRDAGDQGGSTKNRSIFWVSGLRMGTLNPVFGVGYNEFPANVEEYALEEADEHGRHTAHNAWILAFAESGLVGLLLFGSIVYLGFLKPANELYRKDPSWFYAGVMYCVAITFLSHTYMICPYLLAAIVMTTYLAERSAGGAAGVRAGAA